MGKEIGIDFGTTNLTRTLKANCANFVMIQKKLFRP